MFKKANIITVQKQYQRESIQQEQQNFQIILEIHTKNDIIIKTNIRRIIMGLFKFLGMMSLIDESCDKFGTVPTLLGLKAVEEITESYKDNGNEEWEQKVNRIWNSVKDSEEISDVDKEKIYKICQELLTTNNKMKRNELIKELEEIIGKYE